MRGGGGVDGVEVGGVKVEAGLVDVWLLVPWMYSYRM